ncbi:amidohydrolase [Algoriphagus aquimarinus]|uniref:Omega-amidase YafV n=1 Tax=Algoriphagus aquimarinus TaxID=237018 RepID=A0A1I1C4X2_9BACT|nr:amidohydrolase [Algoriphagus aquimarinus]SFB57601.1 Carbon-nitrogen hydrolase [Algoriphagus aquimarinus]
MIKTPQLKIALVQTNLYWKNKVANLAMLEEKMWEIANEVDLIILPEMFPTGFSMDTAELAEPMNLNVCKWMVQMATQKKTTITGSAIIQVAGKYYNRLLWVSPDGTIQHYDKRHLFRMADEDQSFSAGESLPIFELNGWKICPQVCYDLRFPIWSRNRMIDGKLAYDLIFYVASWPAARVSAWDALLPARAIENLAYSIGVNRVDEDGNGIKYNGHSAAYDYKGNQIEFLGESEKITVLTLDAEELDSYREKFPAWMDSDDFVVK